MNAVTLPHAAVIEIIQAMRFATRIETALAAMPEQAEFVVERHDLERFVGFTRTAVAIAKGRRRP